MAVSTVRVASRSLSGTRNAHLCSAAGVTMAREAPLETSGTPAVWTTSMIAMLAPLFMAPTMAATLSRSIRRRATVTALLSSLSLLMFTSLICGPCPAAFSCSTARFMPSSP